MKRRLAPQVKALAALFTVTFATSFAHAQTPTTPPPTTAPAASTTNAQPTLTTVPTLGATPPPVATPAPVVGVNVDPTPAPSATQSMSQPGLPAGYPAASGTPNADGIIQAPPSGADQVQVQKRPGEVTPFNPTVPASGVGGENVPMVEQKPLKSEIISVLPPEQKAPELRAVLRTSVGDITIRLDRTNAPHTVDYFTGLARGDVDFTDIKTSKPVKRPFYNGLIFHRVVKNTLVQTGDPFGTGRGGTGQTIPDEINSSMKFDRPGLVAMAPMREGAGTSLAKNSNSSQFFITLREMPEWNNQFTIFGQVEDGMDVLQKIANVKVGPTERPIKRIYLVAVEIIDSGK